MSWPASAGGTTPPSNMSWKEWLKSIGLTRKTDTALIGRNSPTARRKHDVNPREKRGKR